MSEFILKGDPNPKQKQFFLSDRKYVAYGGARGGGKATPLTSDVLTPFGFKKMGDIKIGDQVSNPDGSVSRVIQVHPQGLQDVYEFNFVDGAKVLATKEHLWAAWHGVRKIKRDLPYKIATTEMLIDSLEKGLNPIIPLTEPVKFTRTWKADMRIIDPYLLGLLLGDGSFTGKMITLTSEDDILDGLDIHVTKTRKDNIHVYTFVKETGKTIRTELKRLGLDNKLSNSKFIPEYYKYADIETRRSIIQGLMDTDGYADDRGHCEFTSVSKQLAEDVQWVIRSLGGKATINTKVGSYCKDGERIECQLVYRVYIQTKDNPSLFCLERKSNRCSKKFNGGISTLGRRLLSIEHKGKEECQCITVDNPNGLYITDDFIVTHNSWAMRRKMVLRRLTYPGSHGLLLRRTYPELLKNHVLPLQAELAQLPGMKYNQKDRVFTFPNNSMLFLGYCDTENDVHQYQGQEFADIGFEEATHFTEYMIQQIGLSCRNTQGVPTRQYYTANPGGVGHQWFKRLFVSKDYKETEDPSDYEFIQALIYDNKVLMETDPNYIKSLINLPEMQRRAFLEGDWDVFEGQFFTEWSSQKHVCEPFDIPKYWERFICIDWGYNDPHAVYWNAMSPDGRLYTYRESYKNKVLATDLARDIAKINKHYKEEINYIVMSPDAWAKRGGGESITDCFLAEELPLRKADNDRLNGWMRMREWMKQAPDGKPAWMIFSNCRNLIRTIPEAPFDEHKVEDVSSTCEDHALESMRYGLMSRPPLTYFDLPSVSRDRFDYDLDDDYEEETQSVWM